MTGFLGFEKVEKLYRPSLAPPPRGNSRDLRSLARSELCRLLSPIQTLAALLRP
jgi:hypothetical protein